MIKADQAGSMVVHENSATPFTVNHIKYYRSILFFPDIKSLQ